MQPHLTIIALSLWLIVFPGLTCVVFALISMWKENRFGWPLRGMIWFTVAIPGSCAVIALLAGYSQKATLCVGWVDPRPAKRYASFQSKFGPRLPVPDLHSVLSMRTSSPLPAPAAKE